MILLFISTISIICLSAFWSLAEASIVGANEFKARNLLKQEIRGAKNLYKVVENKSKYLSTTIVLNTITNVGGSMFIGSLAAKLGDQVNYGLVVGSVTGIMLIFSEIKPKIFASERSESVGLYIAPVLIVLGFLLTPITAFTNLFLNKRSDSQHLDVSEIKLMLSSAGETGVIAKNEADFISNMLALRDKKASDLVTRCGDITTVPIKATVKSAKELALTTKHKRIIAVNKHNQAVGVVLQRDILKAILETDNVSDELQEIARSIDSINLNEGCEDDLSNESIQITNEPIDNKKEDELIIDDIISKFITVREDTLIYDMLPRLYKSETHLAVCLNDADEMVGVITLSNIQESLLI
ncbi:CNNM domain-containing protein [Photobacterium kishitanii]|uniref:DUF21 domain-containing protein n=1 Tax=Photobacterium kishitanii TaxID=318456 RepID=A0A2T3KLW8_9GAMM|nr:CNNM domain-containing protein [Photobacterium kishitanii]PSV00676.1 hypothetical protein C9J27_05925 [Photobacterium kishitanii]